MNGFVATFAITGPRCSKTLFHWPTRGNQHSPLMKTVVYRWTNWLTVLIGCLTLLTCQSPERRTAERQNADSAKRLTPAFYHWKSTYNPTPWEIKLLKRQSVHKLYIHFFDVDWDGRTHQPVPKAFIRFRQKPTGLVVPVVFITNRTLANCPLNQLPGLATHIAQAIRRICQQTKIPVQEVQLDCDWSIGTRAAYFRLLTLLAAQLHWPLSATIRLHQIKYASLTGVPPVARGMLMLYNVADWKRVDTRNSIYETSVADRYMSAVSHYSLPLDVVMPIFRWTIVYRNNRFLTFVNNLDRKHLAASGFVVPQNDSLRFVATRDTVAFGLSIRRGDLFRAESVSGETLRSEKVRILHQIKGQKLTFALYHLDSLALSAYSRETIETLLHP